MSKDVTPVTEDKFPPGAWYRFWTIVFREIDRIDAEEAEGGHNSDQ